MDEIKIWALDGSQATPVSETNMMESEGRLEEALVNNPDMLMPELTLVGRQTDTEGGPLDLLGVDSDGRLVLFELKRGRLSRDAVAQIIDYASALNAMGVDRLATHIAERSGSGGIDKIDDFEEWHAENSDADSLDALLPLRIFLVGLGVDDATERMVNFLAGIGMDISLLTFQGFVQDGKMMLARQMRVAPDDDAVSSQPQPKKRVSQAARREQAFKRAEEGDILDLFDNVREMFRKEFNYPHEGANSIEGANSFGIVIRLRYQMSGRRSTRTLARVSPDRGQVRIVFFRNSIESCREEFRPLLEEIRYETWPARRKNNALESPAAEIQFLVNAEEWETHKDKLSALTGAVYDAIQKANISDLKEQAVNRAEENNILPLFNDVREMFQKGFNDPSERARYNPLGIEIHMRLSGRRSMRADVRVDPTNENGGQVNIVFYGHSVELCREEFRPLLEQIRYRTWPYDRQNTPFDAPQPEIQFLVNAEEWETHKGNLSRLTQAVYAAAQRKAEG